MIDSVTIDEQTFGSFEGGNASKFELFQNENIISVSADRFRFGSDVCLCNLKFVTSEGRIFGPFGVEGQWKSAPVDQIEFSINSINQINFIPTQNGKYIHHIEKQERKLIQNNYYS